MEKIIIRYILLLLVLPLVFQACKKPRSDIGAVLYKESGNKIFKKVDSTQYYQVFRKVLESQKDSISNSALIQEFYRQNGFEPYFIVNFIPKGQLKGLLQRYGQAPAHGLNPDLFNYSELKLLIEKLYDKKAIKSTEDAYQIIARAELLTANSLIKYATALQYGIVNPRKIFARYYMETQKPDSAFMKKVFSIEKMKNFLDSLQPNSPQYLKLQQALAGKLSYPGLNPEDVKKTISLNLERLRWKNKPAADRYVYVNIADYSLRYVENGKTNLAMKVCVGKGPEQEVEEADYDESEGSVRPHNHQTPQLNSQIYNAQVNPIWNIPESIAKNEMYDKAVKDPYYLVNNNIDVFDKHGRKLDADAIDWGSVSKDNMPYSFKQAPGDDNSLGKIKFQFPNASSVYLHDTPAKEPFKLTVRAVSHGCVRLEKPLDLARALYGEGRPYELIRKEMEETNPTSRDIPLPKKVPVYIDYMTCFADDSGHIQIRPDVYKLDEILYNRIKKALAQ